MDAYNDAGHDDDGAGSDARHDGDGKKKPADIWPQAARREEFEATQ